MSTGRWSHLTTGRKAKLVDDAKPKRPHKYHARKTEVNGHIFDSKAEAQRYKELVLLQRAEKITGLWLQPEFILQKPFERDGKKERAIKYIADFEYVEDDKLIVEDVKGIETEGFRLKRRLFLKRFPDIELRIVRPGR